MNASLPPSHSGVLRRAVAASVALVVGIATATGIFVVKIARSAASPSSGTVTDPVDQGGFGSFGGGLSGPQQDQPPAGRSHGS
jgi:hypothetical protein